MTSPVTFERLLAERDWLRALARRLVEDPGAAEDAEQETWTRALSRRPSEGGSVRGWLAAVLRNALRDRARSERSRARREESVARPEAAPSTAEVVARADLQRRLVQAVFDLDPPLREAVILRYFEDLPFAGVGARLGITADAARMRVRRGLEALRARLDTESAGGGGRDAWHAAFVAWLGADAQGGPGALRRPASASAGTGALLGGLAMAGTSKAAVAAAVVVVVLLAGAAVWGVVASQDPAALEGAAATGTAEASRAAPGDDPTRQRARARPPESGTAATDAPPAAPTVDKSPGPEWALRVITNVPGAEVTATFRHYGGAPEAPPATKRADLRGFAGFDLPQHPGGLAEVEVRATAPGFAPATATAVDGVAKPTLEPGVPVRGRIVSSTGAPVAGAWIDVPPGRWAASAADGTFEAWPAAAGAVGLVVKHPAHRPADVEVVAPRDGVEVVLDRGKQVEGRVAFADGTPVPGVSVLANVEGHQVSAKTATDGRYVLTGLPDGEHEIACSACDGNRTARSGATGVDFVVTKSIARVRFVDEDGRPFRHAAIWVRGMVGERLVLAMSGSVDGPDGLLVDVPPGTRLQIAPSAEGYAAGVTETTLDGAASLRDVPVVIRRAGPSGTIELRVLDAAGAPLRETVVSISNEAGAAVTGWYGREVALDAAGRLRIGNMPVGTLRVSVAEALHGVPSASYDLPVSRDVRIGAGTTVPVEVAVVKGGRIVVTVRDAAGAVAARPGRLGLFDAASQRVPGSFWQPNERGGWTSSSDPDAPHPSHFGPVLPAGTYRVRLEREGREPREHDAVVVAGATTQVEFRVAE